MDIHTYANNYKQIIRNKEAEIATIEAKYRDLLQPYYNDIVLQTFLNGTDKVIFESWEKDKKHNFLRNLKQHGVNYHVEQRGSGYDIYDAIYIDW